MGKRLVVIISLAAIGCASTTQAPVAPETRVAEAAPVPLVAPDEAESHPTAKRLSDVRTIGEGSDGYEGRARASAQPGAAPPPALGYANASYPRAAYGYRSMRVVPAPGTPGFPVGTTPGTPAVGGNWRPPPSYGPPAMR